MLQFSELDRVWVAGVSANLVWRRICCQACLGSSQQPCSMGLKSMEKCQQKSGQAGLPAYKTQWLYISLQLELELLLFQRKLHHHLWYNHSEKFQVPSDLKKMFWTQGVKWITSPFQRLIVVRLQVNQLLKKYSAYNNKAQQYLNWTWTSETNWNICKIYWPSCLSEFCCSPVVLCLKWKYFFWSQRWLGEAF